MRKSSYWLIILIALSIGCARQTATNTVPAKVTEGDVAKLKWLEGTWRGMDGDNPFFERYRFEGSTMLVDSFENETLEKVVDTSRFEIKNGVFETSNGDKRTVATSITDNSIQFAPAVEGDGNLYRFERQPDGNWKAILEWPAANGQPARQKVYEMKRWPPDH